MPFHLLGGQKALNYMRETTPPAAWENIPSHDLRSIFRMQGLRFSNEAFSAIRAEVLGYKVQDRRVQSLKPDTAMPSQYHIRNHTRKLKNNYLYEAEVEGTDIETGGVMRKGFSTLSDVRLTQAEVQARAFDAYGLVRRTDDFVATEFISWRGFERGAT